MKLTCQIAVLVVVGLAACGGSDGGKGDAPGARGGAGGKSARAAGMGGDGSSGTDGGGKSVVCGAKTCRVPMDTLYEVCCRDQFSGACGLQVGDMCLQMRSEVAPNCPLPDFPAIADATAGSSAGGGVSGCCTEKNECGVDLGLGAGCSSNSSLCSFFPPQYAQKLQLITCDGEPLPETPPGCTPASE